MKILIVDDHALFREGLCHVLEALEDQVNILEASNYEFAIEYVSNNPDLDLVLLDLHMPDKDGYSVLNTLTEYFPATPVVILSASNLRSDMQCTLDAGAMGFISKDTTSVVMLNALRLVLSGGVYVPTVMVQNQESEQEKKQNINNAPFLTPRQLQVLTLMATGNSNKEIGVQLILAEATVKMHVTSIMKSLGVKNRTQAAMAAGKLGLCIVK
ncbi:MAG: response regulator transcription factor [Gammaproteobacteria bacterium]|nr:response regulator transcription factor [Gammaproteobacteria bacterium]